MWRMQAQHMLHQLWGHPALRGVDFTQLSAACHEAELICSERPDEFFSQRLFGRLEFDEDDETQRSEDIDEYLWEIPHAMLLKGTIITSQGSRLNAPTYLP